MRITVLNQYALGILKVDKKVGNDLQEVMASIKWNLWHGKSAEALEKIGEIDDCIIMHEEDNMVEKRYENSKHLKIISVNFILIFQIIKDLLSIIVKDTATVKPSQRVL